MRLRTVLSQTRATLLAVLMLTATAVAGNHPTESPSSPKPRDNLRSARVLTDHLIGQETRSHVDDRTRPASLLSVLDADTLPSPGIAIGITSYDSQHNAAQGHQVASNPGSETVHFAWTMWDHIPEIDDNDRFVNYSAWDKPSGTMKQGFNGTSVSLGEFARGGMVRIDVDSDNRCHAAFHQRIEYNYPYSIWHLYFPIEGSGLHLDDEMVKPAWPDEVEFLWSDIAVSQNHGLKDNSTDVVHVIGMGLIDVGGGYATPSDRIWYWRYDRGAALAVWEGPVLVDSSRNLSYTIDAADDSGKVAIVFTSNYSTDNLNSLNNVAYRESRTSGSGWLDASELGESFKNLITAYSDTLGGPEAWIETSTAYNHRGVLHIIYTEQRGPGSEEMALKHWSNERGTITTVAEAYYPNPSTWGRDLNIARISLGIGDGATPCRGGLETNEDYLYVLYTKLGGETAEEQTDVSALGLANGELYLAVSSDHGNHWTQPVNLTNTKTPGCTSADAGSVCASESWATIARDISDIEILYILDFEAGAFDEAPWSMNRAMYLNLPGGTVDDPFLCPGASCFCPCHGDPQCDGVDNVLDVVIAINVAFRSADEVYDYDCAYARTDVTCDGVTDVVDVVRYVDVVFRDADPAELYCDPCAP